jgi:hypothetical protein
MGASRLLKLSLQIGSSPPKYRFQRLLKLSPRILPSSLFPPWPTHGMHQTTPQANVREEPCNIFYKLTQTLSPLKRALATDGCPVALVARGAEAASPPRAHHLHLLGGEAL